MDALTGKGVLGRVPAPPTYIHKGKSHVMISDRREWTFSDMKETIHYFRLDGHETGWVDLDFAEPEAYNLRGPSKVKKYKSINTKLVHIWRLIQNEKSKKLQIIKANKYLKLYKIQKKKYHNVYTNELPGILLQYFFLHVLTVYLFCLSLSCFVFVYLFVLV